MEKKAAEEKENEMKERKVEFDWFQNIEMIHDNLCRKIFPASNYSFRNKRRPVRD